MCGIVGLIAKKKNGFFTGDTKTFLDMLVIDQLRGTDGTGLFYNNKDDGTAHFAKAPVTASYFIEYDVCDKAAKAITNKATFVVGHNRAATKGKLTTECTHPFQEDHITLVHNGTLPSYDNLAKKARLDSHAIAIHMAENSAKETLKEIDGAFSLVWYDEKTKTLHFSRNYQRPLNIIETDRYWVLSSEPEIAKCALERGKVKVIDVKEVETKKLYSINLDPSLEEFEIKSEDAELRDWTSSTNWNYQQYLGLPATSNKASNDEPKWPWGELPGAEVTNPSDKIDYSTVLRPGYIIDFWADKIKNKLGRLTALVEADSETSPYTYKLLGKKLGTTGERVIVNNHFGELSKLDQLKQLTGVVSRVIIKGKKVTYFVDKAWISDDQPPEDVELCCECSMVAKTTHNQSKGSVYKGEWSCPDCTEAYTKLANQYCGC